MTESAGVGLRAGRDLRPRFRQVVLTLLRVVCINAALIVIYFLLPLDRTSIGSAIALLAFGLLALVGLVAFQVRNIIRADHPVLKAVGALATSAPLFLLLFSGAYYVIAHLSASNFNQSMTRVDALYFTVTVFATVGFGDIVATSQAARALVTGQMVAGIVIVGLGARIIVDAVKFGREQTPVPSRRPASATGDTSSTDRSSTEGPQTPGPAQ